jgi:hypothetical protein
MQVNMVLVSAVCASVSSLVYIVAYFHGSYQWKRLAAEWEKASKANSEAYTKAMDILKRQKRLIDEQVQEIDQLEKVADPATPRKATVGREFAIETVAYIEQELARMDDDGAPITEPSNPWCGYQPLVVSVAVRGDGKGTGYEVFLANLRDRIHVEAYDTRRMYALAHWSSAMPGWYVSSEDVHSCRRDEPTNVQSILRQAGPISTTEF